MDKTRKRGIHDIILLGFGPKQLWDFLPQRSRSPHRAEGRAGVLLQLEHTSPLEQPEGWAGMGCGALGAGLPTACQHKLFLEVLPFQQRQQALKK